MMQYNPAFDLYHSIFRMVHIASRLEEGEAFEIERVRIWDFYLLYPDKVHKIKIKREEKEMNQLRSELGKYNNPYVYSGEPRKHFEQMRPYQMSALGCLVACGILSKEDYQMGRIVVSNRSALEAFLNKAGKLSAWEYNSLSFLSLFSRHMPLKGIDGLKDRTRLMDSKYDAD